MSFFKISLRQYVLTKIYIIGCAFSCVLTVDINGDCGPDGIPELHIPRKCKLTITLPLVITYNKSLPEGFLPNM